MITMYILNYYYYYFFNIFQRDQFYFYLQIKTGKNREKPKWFHQFTVLYSTIKKIYIYIYTDICFLSTKNF